MKNRMTESEWNASGNSYLMLRSSRHAIVKHPRKGRLFAVACCRRIQHLMTDPRSLAAVEMTATYAERLANETELAAAAKAAEAAHREAFNQKGKIGACTEWAAQFGASLNAWFAATRASNFACVAAGDPALGEGSEHAAQADLLRCIFGPLPFRTVSLEPAFLTSTVVQLAGEIYDSQRFERLPELGDALEGAGCTNSDVLTHCHHAGSDVRGCWVVDLVLEKE